MRGKRALLRWSGWTRHFLFALGCSFLGVCTAAASARAIPLSPDQVQAAYLFNFTQFIIWPEKAFSDPTSPLVIGILGRDSFGKLLRDVVRGEKSNGREIVVRHFARIQDIDTCHVLFIDRSHEPDLPKVLPSLTERHVLTVSNMAGFARRGGMIEFFEDNARIRFRVDVHRAKTASLEISAKLLRPAEIVEPNTQTRTHWSEFLAAAIAGLSPAAARLSPQGYPDRSPTTVFFFSKSKPFRLLLLDQAPRAPRTRIRPSKTTPQYR